MRPGIDAVGALVRRATLIFAIPQPPVFAVHPRDAEALHPHWNRQVVPALLQHALLKYVAAKKLHYAGTCRMPCQVPWESTGTLQSSRRCWREPRMNLGSSYISQRFRSLVTNILQLQALAGQDVQEAHAGQEDGAWPLLQRGCQAEV